MIISSNLRKLGDVSSKGFDKTIHGELKREGSGHEIFHRVWGQTGVHCTDD